MTSALSGLPPQLIDDVIASVDVKRFAGDKARRVVRQEGRCDADILDADEAAREAFRTPIYKNR